MIGWIAFIACSWVLIAICKFLVRPDIDPEAFKNYNAKTTEITPAMKTSIKGAIISVIFIVIAIALPAMAPDGWWITQILTNLGTVGSIFIGTIILCFVPNGKNPKEKLMNFGEKAQKNMDMNNLFCMGGCLCIGSYLSSDEVGLSALLTSICQPLIDAMGPVLFIGVLCIITCLITNLTLNVLFVLTLGTFAFAAFSTQPVYMAMAAAGIVLATTMAIAMPSSSGPALIVYSRTDVVKTQHIIGWGTLMCLLATVIMYGLLILMQGMLI